MSPKSFIRKPKKKRKAKRGFLVGYVVACLFLIVIGVAILLISLQRSGIISPLPSALGERLKINASEKDETELKRLLGKHNIVYTSVASTQDDFVITMNAKQQVLVTKKKDIDSQISSLQVILPRLTMEGRAFRRLDMRFEKPVVVY